jgi:hypothetical protein
MEKIVKMWKRIFTFAYITHITNIIEWENLSANTKQRLMTKED